jgi:vacuolar-type H+-ATPase subunit I/STV1
MSSESKTSSLRWAIDELSKQKDELSSKLNIAQKREDTNYLIDEVNAQKEALEKRISSLEDGFKASSELVDEPVANLTEELEKIDDKLAIAQDRLNTLEQEEYLEDLGRKLNGDISHIPSSEIDDMPNLSVDSQNVIESAPPTNLENASSSLQSLPSPTPVLMKSPTNRIETKEETSEDTSSRMTESDSVIAEPKIKVSAPMKTQGLEDCAKSLGMEPEFLLNQGIQAVLRMIARNGNKVSFPLEVDQIEKS